MIPLNFKYLGEQDYLSCFHDMQAHIDQRIEQKKHNLTTANEVWFVTHPNVYTLGQAGDRAHILNANGVPVVKTDRGGQVTWHGQGQLVAYFLFDLSALDWHVRQLVSTTEDIICDFITAYLEPSQHHFVKQRFVKPRKDAPGIYVYEKNQPADVELGKIASLGFKIKRGFCYHGVAINIDADLSYFDNINPCGFAGMTMLNLVDIASPPDIDVLTSALTELIRQAHITGQTQQP